MRSRLFFLAVIDRWISGAEEETRAEVAVLAGEADRLLTSRLRIYQDRHIFRRHVVLVMEYKSREYLTIVMDSIATAEVRDRPKSCLRLS